MEQYKAFTSLSRQNVFRRKKNDTKSPRMPTSNDMPAELIRANGKSIAFTVDFVEPPSPIKRQGLQRLQLNYQRYLSNRLDSNLDVKIELANLRRMSLLAETLGRLKRRRVEFKQRKEELARQAKLEKIRLKAHAELESELATMRRDMFIERLVQKYQQKHQRVAQISLENTLRKSMNLKKSYSVGVLQELVEPEPKINKSKSMSNLLDTPVLTDLKAVFGNGAQPPITKKSLQELSLVSISSNMALRHDMLFDETLELRPNEEGEKGAKKKAKADAFWNMLTEEVYSNDKEPNYEKVPVLFHEAKLIMLEMAANADYKVQLEHHLDVFLLHQQLQKGVFDPVSLITYLADVFKAHCAPQRDLLIEVMVRQCQEGQFINSLRLVFEVLEKMRLDVANDQIRTLKPVFIQNAVVFEWNTFQEAMKSGSQSVDKTVRWLTPYKSVGNPLIALQKAYIDLISNYRTDDEAPETFYLDFVRLQKFHYDWQDAAIVACILMMFRQVAGPRYNVHHGKIMKTNLWSLLNEEDTTIAHITTQVAHVGGQIRGKQLSSQEFQSLSSLIDKTLSKDSKIHDIIYSRIQQVLMTGLDADFLAKNGLLELEEELTTLSKDVQKLYDHNRQVYKLIYDQILMQ